MSIIKKQEERFSIIWSILSNTPNTILFSILEIAHCARPTVNRERKAKKKCLKLKKNSFSTPNSIVYPPVCRCLVFFFPQTQKGKINICIKPTISSRIRNEMVGNYTLVDDFFPLEGCDKSQFFFQVFWLML